MKHEYQETVAVDKYGVDCLSSGQDKEILLYFRNPQMYTLLLGITSASGEAGNTTFSVAQTPDKSIAKITLKEDFLTSLECGGIFSPTVTLVEKKSMRRFADYSFNLKINSVPPAPQGAVVLVTSATPKKYVLCFNLPDHSDVSGIHRDIKTLTVESNGSVKNRKIFLKPSSGNVSVYADEELLTPLSDVKTSVTTGEITENTDEGAAQLGFTAGENPVYIFTGDNLVPITNNISYKITLTDECGLSATASTSVYSQKLNVPTATALSYADNESVSLNDAAATEIIQNEDGAGYVKLILPTTSTTGLPVSSCTVDYKIYGGTSFDTLLGEGSVSSSKEIPVPPVECKIKAYAKNPAYVSSDFAWFHVKPVCTKIYVDASGSESGWGTKSKPVNKIKTVLTNDLFADKTNPENTIVLLSDVEDGDISIGDETCFTLTSQNTSGNTAVHTITPVSSSCNFMSLSSYADVYIENVIIKDFTSSTSGGAFAVADANLYLTNVELTHNTSSANGGALYLSHKNSFISLFGKSVVSSNTAAAGNGAYIGNKEAILIINDDSYFDQQNEVYLCAGAVLYAHALCTASKVACVTPASYPEDPVVDKINLLSITVNAVDETLDGEFYSTFCNTRVTVAKNPDKPDVEYYVVYSDFYRVGILAKGTSANVTTKLPDKVIFHQLYLKGIYLTFYATDGSGNRLSPQSSSIKVKLRSDVLSSESKDNGYVQHTIPTSIENMIEDGKIDGETVTVELSIKISGIVYSASEDMVKSSAIEDGTTLAHAIDFVNTLEDSSNVKIEISQNITVTDSTPLLGTADHKFNGTFDGHGHTIKLAKSRSDTMAAIANYVGPKGVIKNVVIAGDYNYDNGGWHGANTGGITVNNEGLIINCVNYLNIRVDSIKDSGGIAEYNSGKIINCANFGKIYNKMTVYGSTGWAGVYGMLGGITGRNAGKIENCFNCGDIQSSKKTNVVSATNGMPGAITGSQYKSAEEFSGQYCYWKDGCVSRGTSSSSEAYNSFVFKNSLLSFFWSYGNRGSSIDSSNKFNETFIYSCGTFADASSDIVAGTEQNSEHAQTLTYNGTLLEVMNAYVNGKSKKYSFNGAYIDLLEWEADSAHEGYPKLKFPTNP